MKDYKDRKYKYDIGDIVGDLECVDIIKPKKKGNRRTLYVMKCLKCGRIKEMMGPTIHRKSGIKHKSCGKGVKTLDPIFYDRWQGMRTRTTNPKYEHYNAYGGRGINSDEFENFIDFYDKMYDSWLEACIINGGNRNGISLERNDVNGNYTKENCSWIPLKDQHSNTRKNVKYKIIDPNGNVIIGKNLTKFCKKHHLSRDSMTKLLNGKRTEYKGYIGIKISEEEFNDYRKDLKI